ncbi:alpha/beta fold hydrolase [Ornithinibacillus scapharcae]|uniref:alpha/beta fold hydrolase n=1 Tax=Ornithinibacillus scapharcae TaxID=1147159 RepID=UPI000225BAA8|nr:alpha/beta hydrolase [Ornithinibacillus scapharcae]
MEFRTSDGLALFYDQEGTGTPCIFLHGGPGYWSKSFQHFTSGTLTKEIKMIYLDQRGCGRSELADNGDYSLERLLLDLEELRVHLQIDKWYVMGHSFGGLLATNYAHQYPEHVMGLILSNATLHLKESFSAQIHKGRELLELSKVDISADIATLVELFFGTAQALIEMDLFYKLQYQSLTAKEKVDLIDVDFSSNGEFQQYIFSSEEFFQDFRKLTSSISTPVFVLSGKYDDAIGPEHQEGFQFRQAVYQELETGHHPYVEVSEKFSKAVLDFIKNS